MFGKNITIRMMGFACLLTALLLFAGCEPGLLLGEAAPAPEQYSIQGYSFAEYEGESPQGETFLACGSGGRLDRIYADGTVETIPLPDVDEYLTQVLVGQDITLLSGQSGTLLYSRDGKEFTAVRKVTNSDIVGLARFNGKYYACARNGAVFMSDDGISWKKRTNLSNKSIVSFTATEDYIGAISDDTDIFMSSDGENWDEQNYNETTNGGLVFTKLVNLSPSFFIIGYYEDDPDWPFLIFSDSGGEIWLHKTLDEINELPPGDFAPLNINHVCVFAGELMGVCNDGRVLAITECSTCNTISEASEADLHGIALSETNMLVVGDDFEFAVLDALDFRQDKIKAEQAYEDFVYNGAVIVDVRTLEEYDELHIRDALHIPVDEITSRLPVELPDPDTEIIFYCAAGARSQTALETAQELGYLNVFNLGGLSDWLYDTEQTQ